MIPNTKDRELSSNGVTDSQIFGISTKDSAHIMTILRDTLYSDKILAVLREYGSNAWDAHRICGKTDVPIKITLPTLEKPMLSIRDWGPGLSHTDVFEVFTQYGASTKRNDDNAVGMLGIGSKSGFAYSDSFTVTSWNGGFRRIYVAVLDETDKGIINLLNEDPCGATDTGVQIQIAVKPEDIGEFERKARLLFNYFIPQPIINTELPALLAGTKVSGNILNAEYGGSWTAVMGCIPYNIDTNHIRGFETNNVSLEYLNKLSGILYFDIGEVQISASRESLKYSTLTKKAIVAKINSAIDEYVLALLANVENTAASNWERRLGLQNFIKLGLPIPDNYSSLSGHSVGVNNECQTFKVTRNNYPVGSIRVYKDTKLILQDTDKSINGYNLNSYDFLITRDKDCEWPIVEKELKEVIDILQLDGITISRLSDMKWEHPTITHRNKIKRIQSINIKHRVNTFKLKDTDRGFRSPWSRFWEVEKRIPTKDDVFVILQEFKGVDYDFYKQYVLDKALIKSLGGTMPPIYGYKYTAKKPIKPTDCVGIHYLEWEKTFLQPFITDEIKENIKHLKFASYQSMHHWVPLNEMDYIKTELGENHIIVNAINSIITGDAFYRDNYQLRDSMNTLITRLKDLNYELELIFNIEEYMEKLFKIYPIIRLLGGLHNLWQEKDSCKELINYIKLVDSANERGRA